VGPLGGSFIVTEYLIPTYWMCFIPLTKLLLHPLPSFPDSPLFSFYAFESLFDSCLFVAPMPPILHFIRQTIQPSSLWPLVCGGLWRRGDTCKVVGLKQQYLIITGDGVTIAQGGN